MKSLEVNMGVRVGDEGRSEALLLNRIYFIPLNVNSLKLTAN